MPWRTFVAAALLLCAAEAHAQQQVDVDSLRRSLAADTVTSALRQREAALKTGAATSVEAALERGLVLMRLHELGGRDRDISQARDVLERAADKNPNDARAHYAYGLSNSVGHGVRIPSPLGALNAVVIAQSMAELVKADPVSKAKSSFKKALKADPLMASAAIGLARLSLDSRDKDNLTIAAAALRHINEQQRGGAEVATVLSEVEAALGNVDAAASAAAAATEMDAASSSALRAQAAALLRRNGQLEAGARSYFAGVDILDVQGADQYFDDVLPIATDAERAAWANADLVQRKTWLRRFWTLRAAGAGITVGERMAEHYQRLALAHERYRRTSKRGAAPGGALVKEKYAEDMLPFDDRGLILVRHGQPDETVRTSDVDLRPNESWVYRKGSKNLLYNFVVLRDGTDYRLVDDVLLALDPSTQGVPAEAAVKLLQDRQAYEPRYAALATQFGAFGTMTRRHTIEANMGMAAERRQRVAQELREVALEALETDSDQPDFTGDLPFYYDLYSFKGENGATSLTVAAAIPGTSVSARQIGSNFIYALQASLILIDTATADVARKDTTFSLRSSRPLGDNEHLRLHIDLPARSTSSMVHRVVLRDLVTPGKGQLYGGDAEIKNFTGTSLMLSDVVLAEPDNGTWQRGEARLGLVPPRQFMEGKPLRLFYEIYNLPGNADYRTEIIMEPVEGETGFGRIKKLFGGGGNGVRLQFDGVAPSNTAGVVQELRQVTTQVKPGKYRVSVRVTNLQNAQSVRSETMFVVLKD
ncbi:MAG TPA: GWxTD domain-containing protein [Longimicrobiales bacterium]|nr:GWxTD domain-containing protein [Longimicrobiales bacterium]